MLHSEQIHSLILFKMKTSGVIQFCIKQISKLRQCGFVAAKYYSTVAPLIKKYDPNH